MKCSDISEKFYVTVKKIVIAFLYSPVIKIVLLLFCSFFLHILFQKQIFVSEWAKKWVIMIPLFYVHIYIYIYLKSKYSESFEKWKDDDLVNIS